MELKEGEKATEEEIKEHCKSEMAGFKVPKHFIFHKILRASAGKMDRPGLTELALKELGLKK